LLIVAKADNKHRSHSFVFL